MKKIYLFLAGLMTVVQVSSQWLTQSAEGKGTVLSKGATVSLDVAKTDLSFSINNLNKPVWVQRDSQEHRLLFGGSLSAKNEEGLGNLFSKGDFVPSSRLTGYFGIRLFDHRGKLPKEKDIVGDALVAINEQQVLDFRARTIRLIEHELNDQDDIADDLGKRLIKDWSGKLEESVAYTFISYLKNYVKVNSFASEVVKVANVIDNVIKGIKTILKEHGEEQDKIRKELIDHHKGFVASNQTNLSIFTFGGIDASSFKRVDSIHTTNPSRSFIKEEFRGGTWGVGMNYQYNRLKIGLTYAYRKTNNFGLLDKTDYTLTTTYNSGGQELKQSKPVTAYSGVYGPVEVNELNIDILYTLGLGKSSDTYAMVNGYLRSNMFSRDKELLPGSFNIGLASYFFTRKSKFLGGIYVELPDVDDNYEKSKSVDEQIIRPAIRRLTFGIVSKFSINSLISWQ